MNIGNQGNHFTKEIIDLLQDKINLFCNGLLYLPIFNILDPILYMI